MYKTMASNIFDEKTNFPWRVGVQGFFFPLCALLFTKWKQKRKENKQKTNYIVIYSAYIYIKAFFLLGRKTVDLVQPNFYTNK